MLYGSEGWWSGFGSWAREIKQITGIKQSQIKEPWPSSDADALSEPESMHGKSHALSLAQLPKPDRLLLFIIMY